jgi:hypothetical protein
MIENVQGHITFYCDVCGQETFEPETREWKEAWNEAREWGWRSKYDPKLGRWNHSCKGCSL